MKISKVKVDIVFILICTLLILTISNIFSTKPKTLEKIEETRYKSVMLSAEEQETLDLINKYRSENGLSELKTNKNLQNMAKIKAEDLVNNNYFSHNSPNLGTPFEMLEKNNIDYMIAGENLAGNTTPERAVKAWIDSDSHRDNILEEFEYTGIYVINSEKYGKIFVQLFLGI